MITWQWSPFIGKAEILVDGQGYSNDFTAVDIKNRMSIKEFRSGQSPSWTFIINSWLRNHCEWKKELCTSQWGILELQGNVLSAGPGLSAPTTGGINKASRAWHLVKDLKDEPMLFSESSGVIKCACPDERLADQAESHRPVAGCLLVFNTKYGSHVRVDSSPCGGPERHVFPRLT